MISPISFFFIKYLCYVNFFYVVFSIIIVFHNTTYAYRHMLMWHVYTYIVYLHVFMCVCVCEGVVVSACQFA